MTRRRRKSNRGGGIIIFVIIALVAVIAFLTNPNEAAHKEAMNVRANTIMDEIVAEQNPLVSIAWNTLGGSRLLNEFVNASVTTDNYFLFSVTKINWDNDSYIVGIGAFGNVFISRRLNKDTVHEIIEDARNNVITTIPAFLRIILQ
jgi:hypothetical protein